MVSARSIDQGPRVRIAACKVVRTSADIQLRAGEYAVHEGGERALYAVLSGKFEAVKHFDGVERTLGWRLPGAIFGEVPLVPQESLGFEALCRMSSDSQDLV